MSEPTMGTLRIEFQEILSKIDVTCTYNYGMDMKKYVEGGPEWPDPGGSMKYQFAYLNVVAVCLNELDSVCLNGWAGQGKPSRR